MSENEQNDSYNDVFTLTAGAADSRPDSSAKFTPSISSGQALSEAERGRNGKNSERKGAR